MSIKDKGRVSGHYSVRCFGPDGKLKWEDGFDNIIVTEGLNHILDSTLGGASQVTAWYVGLLDADAAPAAGWGATEVGGDDFVDYAEGTLPVWTPDGGAAAGSVSNSSSPASFAINQDSSVVGGAFLISTSAKATPAGTLYSAGTFSSDKNVDDGDTLQVTATFTQADA